MVNENDGFFINVEGKTGGPFPRDAILKEIERGRFKGMHFVWDAQANRWLKAAEHPLFSQCFQTTAKAATAKKYYLSRQGARFGPFSVEEVEGRITAAEFERGDYIWENTLKKWVKLGEVADFADVFTELDAREPEVPPPLPDDTPPPPSAFPTLGNLMAAPVPPISTVPFAEMAPPAAPAPFKPIAPVPPQPAPRERHTPQPALPLAPVPPSYPPGLTAAPAPAGPRVGEIVNLSFAEPPKPTAPIAPAAVAAPASPQVKADDVEFRRLAAADEALASPGAGVKVDRSVVLDFSKPTNLRRIAAQVVDFALMGLSYFLIALIFSSLNMNPYLPGPDQYYFQQLFWVTISVVCLLYFLLRDAGGASIGKRIMGLRVVKINDFGRQANMIHSIARNITLLIPLLNILEIAYVVNDTKGRRAGDRLAGTVLTETTDIDYIRQHQGLLDEIY